MKELVENFRRELDRIYADAKPARRDHIAGATARLRAKYNAKLVNARRDDPVGADAAERGLTECDVASVSILSR